MGGIVIVGAGECGLRAAFAARDAGHAGAICVIGKEAALPYERPPLSKPDATGVIEKPITSRKALADKGIDLRSGIAVTGLDRENRRLSFDDGSAIGYDWLLLATGARPRRLTCLGGEHAVVFRTLEDARHLYRVAGPDRDIVIVGAGLIGLELAAVLTARGTRVTVLEAGPRPLGRNVPERFALQLADRHKAHGVEIHCGVSIAECTGSEVRLADGRDFKADVIVAAIGVEPNTALAESAGLAVHNGICVDDSLRTADSAIFAAGDCAAVQMTGGGYRRFETWQSAQAQGSVAGRNLALGNERHVTPAWFWSDQYDLGLQGVGDTLGAPAATRTLGETAEVQFFVDTDGRLIGAAGLGPGNSVAKDIKIAQRLIGTRIDAGLLSDPSHNLKKLLRAA